MASYKKIGNTGIKYSRENPLGQGTYGSFYLGIYNDQQVAVKRLELKQSEKEEREVNLQQNLDHENVLKIRKVEKDDDFRYD
jgi:serine/threonine protein kinase